MATGDDELSDEIAANALRPQSTSVDGESITERSIQDQIAADKHLKGERAVAATSLGLRFGKIVSPGAVNA